MDDQFWSFLGTLDNPVLVAATSDPAFDDFSLWRIDAAQGGVVANATVPTDFELELLAGGQALHTVGVLNLSSLQSYAFGFQSDTPSADLTIELLINGTVFQTLPATSKADNPLSAGASFDLSALDTDVFTIGVDQVALRITNNSTDSPVRLDNFAVSGARFDKVEG